MRTPTERIQDYFNGLMTIVDSSTKSQEDQILMAGAMMAVAKMLYHNNLTENEHNNILHHNVRDLINLIKPPIH